MNISSQLLKNHIYQKCHRPFLQNCQFSITLPPYQNIPWSLCNYYQILSIIFRHTYNNTWLSDFKVTHIFHKLGVNNISYQTISLLFVAVCRILTNVEHDIVRERKQVSFYAISFLSKKHAQRNRGLSSSFG